jgi:nucleoside-diphosphate-sugar epimerase
MRILVTGSAGFVAGYLVEKPLPAGHKVIGLDNSSKYGPPERGCEPSMGRVSLGRRLSNFAPGDHVASGLVASMNSDSGL